jgi:large subunit ribosomal protein L10
MSNQKKRPEVVAIYNEVSNFIAGKEFSFLLNFGGLTVAQIADLRAQLATKGAAMMVIKNTFIAKVAAEQGIEFPEGILTGPTAVITGTGDIADTAKTVVDFVKKNDKAAIKAGLMEKNVISAAEVTTLSELISLAAQQARLLGTLQAPASQMARVLQAKVDKENEGGAPASAEGTPDGTPAA